TARAFSRPVVRAAPSTAARTPRARIAKMTAATMPSIRPKPASSPGRGRRAGRGVAGARGPVGTRVIADYIDRAGPRVEPVDAEWTGDDPLGPAHRGPAGAQERREAGRLLLDTVAHRAGGRREGLDLDRELVPTPLLRPHPRHPPVHEQDRREPPLGPVDAAAASGGQCGL